MGLVPELHDLVARFRMKSRQKVLSQSCQEVCGYRVECIECPYGSGSHTSALFREIRVEKLALFPLSRDHGCLDEELEKAEPDLCPYDFVIVGPGQIGANELSNYLTQQLDHHGQKHGDHPNYELGTGGFHMATESGLVLGERKGIQLDSGGYAVLDVVVRWTSEWSSFGRRLSVLFGLCMFYQMRHLLNNFLSLEAH